MTKDIEHERKSLVTTGQKVDSRDYDKRIRILAAAQVCLKYDVSTEVMAKITGISVSSIYHGISDLAKKGTMPSFFPLMKRRGRPPKYPLDVDAVLMIWIEDEERVARDRMIDAIMLKYKEIAVELGHTIPILDDCLKQHIQKLYRRKDIE